ncbi:vitellogenin-1 [Drosophila ananassae]|nr:vitellogenin-1 [Drosophila ananassae]
MRLCFLVLGCVIAASAWPVNDISLRVHGLNGWYVPQVTGGLRWVTKSEGERELASYENQLEGRLSTNTVKFYLYTRTNPSVGQEIKATQASIDSSNFNPENPTRITIHGWNANYKDGVNTRIANAWFQFGDYNMIAVDWARGRSLEYASSVAGAPGAGKKIAALVDFLVENKSMNLGNLEVVGFSLGAHVAGFTAKNVASGKVGKVVGLDPASPLVSYSNTEKRLASGDAQYVEVIHTNGGTLGFTKTIGQADFYMNGGKSQPGCGFDITGSCSHTRAVMYYSEALLWNNFPSKRCETYQQANKNSCGDQFSTVQMGAFVNAFMAEGIFYVPVNKESPFGFGEKATETTSAPEITTTRSEEETTAAPGGQETTAAPGGEETTAAPGGEETTAAPGGEETTAAPGGEETTAAPEDDETTVVPGEETTDAGDDETTETPGENGDDSTTEEPEEVPTTSTIIPETPTVTTTTEEPTTTTIVPETPTVTTTTEEPTTTTIVPATPTVTTTTEEPTTTTIAPVTPTVTTTTEEPTTTPIPVEPPTVPTTTEEPTTITTISPPDDDKKPPSSSKNIFILNVFLVNVKVEK